MTTLNVSLDEFEAKVLLKQKGESLALFTLEDDSRMVNYMMAELNEVSVAFREGREYKVDSTDCLYIRIAYEERGNEEKMVEWEAYYKALTITRKS
jgi:hypothetical protein